MQEFAKEFRIFLIELFKFTKSKSISVYLSAQKTEDKFVGKLYRQRGKNSKRLIHIGMTILAVLGILIGPYVAKEFPGRSVNPWSITNPPEVLSASTDTSVTSTNISSAREGIISYTVQDGDTISSIADKFGISGNTIIWQNKLTSADDIKIGDTLQILPVTGIAHTVVKGDTVQSIAKKYGLPSAEAIVEFPFNTFADDETFSLAIGQIVYVPNGAMPSSSGSVVAVPVQVTPNAGTVVASGQFVWPTQGVITQGFYWYHPGVDIANPAEPNILAADSGTIIREGWDNTGYGNMIMIDHGNGYQTLYAHMSAFYVTLGQTVHRGDVIGRMGSTGNSTGPHLHFEVHQAGVHLNPLNFLQ
ncbi:MAG TPA: M23 family metallopeptidase [Patescibacteria group bacterium]|nr:M23 family metallopeptidase [Patescibacteria group bacterium]